MSAARKSILVALIVVLAAGSAPAGTVTVLNFDTFTKTEFEQVLNYYAGGSGSQGTGPGPNLGITFSMTAVADHRDTPIPNDPSPPTDLLLSNSNAGAGQPQTMTMDVTGGFSQDLIFSYVAIGRAGSAQIWSGLDGTGSMLAMQALATVNTPVFSNPLHVPFQGTARSVVFTGGNLQLALDDITFPNLAPVPEPSAWLLLAIGLASLCLIRWLWPRMAAAR
jgi:hypothetical protein